MTTAGLSGTLLAGSKYLVELTYVCMHVFMNEQTKKGNRVNYISGDTESKNSEVFST